jgi:hypothetical protein
MRGRVSVDWGVASSPLSSSRAWKNRLPRVNSPAWVRGRRRGQKEEEKGLLYILYGRQGF